MVDFELMPVHGLVPDGFYNPQALIGIDNLIANLEGIHKRLLYEIWADSSIAHTIGHFILPA
jgi:hypothetical protein